MTKCDGMAEGGEFKFCEVNEREDNGNNEWSFSSCGHLFLAILRNWWS